MTPVASKGTGFGLGSTVRLVQWPGPSGMQQLRQAEGTHVGILVQRTLPESERWVISSAARIRNEWMIRLVWAQQQTLSRYIPFHLWKGVSPHWRRRTALLLTVSSFMASKDKSADLCLPLRLACNSLRVLLSLYSTGTILQQILEVRKKEEKVEGNKIGGVVIVSIFL